MRLQSAIFTLEDTLFTPDGKAREGLDKALSLSVALCKVDSATMFERAMKRLHGQKDDTVVFSGSLSALEHARDAGFRTVAVRGEADDGTWDAMRAIAAQSLAGYGELLAEEG